MVKKTMHIPNQEVSAMLTFCGMWMHSESCPFPQIPSFSKLSKWGVTFIEQLWTIRLSTCTQNQMINMINVLFFDPHQLQKDFEPRDSSFCCVDSRGWKAPCHFAQTEKTKTTEAVLNFPMVPKIMTKTHNSDVVFLFLVIPQTQANSHQFTLHKPLDPLTGRTTCFVSQRCLPVWTRLERPGNPREIAGTDRDEL